MSQQASYCNILFAKKHFKILTGEFLYVSAESILMNRIEFIERQIRELRGDKGFTDLAKPNEDEPRGRQTDRY